MVSFHVWTFVWILVFLFVFSTIADANNNKHHTAHRHGHRRHRHRKHSKPQSRLIKKFTSEDNTKRKNTMALISSSTPWFLNETSTSLHSSKNNYSDYDKLASKSFVTIRNTNANSKNNTYVQNSIRNKQIFNDSSDIAQYNDSLDSILKNKTVNSPIFDAVTIDREILKTMNKSEETNDIAFTDSSSSSIPSQEKEHRTFSKELEKLFGSTEDHTNFPEILTDPPNVQLIRKKRSISREEIEANHEKIKEPTLLSFDGPQIVSDPEETAERESSESLHVRVKRDGSEYDESPSVISSQDSNYLQDLENSFALSALEIEARDSSNSEVYRRESRSGRTSLDLSPNLLRPKREAEDVQNYNINDASAASEIPASSNAIPKKDNDTLFNKTVPNDYLLEANNLNLSTSMKNKDEENTDITIDPLIKKIGTSENNRFDTQKRENNSYSFDSSTIFSQSTGEASNVRNETDTTYLRSSSQSLDSTDSIGKDDEPITGYRFEDPENEDRTSFDSSVNTEVSKRKVEAIKYQPEVSSVDSSLKDEDSIAKNGLDDVYPDIVENPSNPSPMVQLVRTKRFNNIIVDPEASEISYANNRISDEPYAEDNIVIDSMLSKVDYRNADEPKRSERSVNEEIPLENEEMYSLKRDDSALRSNRAISSRRTRKKGGGSRYLKNRKKIRKSRAKKHHRPKHKRSKVKRESEDLSERAENKPELENENFSGEKLEAMEQDIISPHDGRRRRESEDEEDLYPDAKETETREFRDSRDNAELTKPDNEKEIERCVEARSKLYEEAKTREKRDNSLQELKYFQNVRETDGRQNRSGDIGDKSLLRAEAIKPIKDIERLAEELLAKVNELHGYINIAGATEDSQASGTSSSIVDSKLGDGSKVVKRVTNSDDPSSRSATAANVVRRSEACRKSPEQSKPERNSRGQRCIKKIRRKRTSHRKWDRWTDWSSCSVTCGRGRQIRWRHCIRNCSTAETEMEEKACQLPACAPGKFLGIFG